MLVSATLWSHWQTVWLAWQACSHFADRVCWLPNSLDLSELDYHILSHDPRILQAEYKVSDHCFFICWAEDHSADLFWASALGTCKNNADILYIQLNNNHMNQQYSVCKHSTAAVAVIFVFQHWTLIDVELQKSKVALCAISRNYASLQ